MKKLICVFMAVLLSTTALVACKASEPKMETEAKLSIVTTIFPEYDWVRELTKGNENIQLTMLLDKGVDLHSFQPSADDIIKISDCDMFIYVGGESDEWVEDALAEATNKDMVVINLLESLGDGLKEEELVEGMEDEEEEEEEEEDGEEGPEYDEHVWLSLKNASLLCGVIEEGLEKIDQTNADLYKSNLESYTKALEQLDSEYEASVSQGTKDTVLFGDRFPFRYLVDDYGLNYYAAFVGCSAESEASFETITFLSKKADELNLEAVLQIETADGKIAKTIVENTASKDQKVLTMNSMQSVTSKDVEEGASYLGIMEENLKVLEEAIR